MSIRLRIYPRHAESLAQHVEERGFPVTPVGRGEFHVLFPGSPGIFAAAVELDLWIARGGSCSSLVIEPGAGTHVMAAADR
jgi:hypothetical protein